MRQPSSPSSPLLIALIGPGGIGSAYAFQLARAGHDVTVVARPGSQRLRQLQRDQAIVDAKGDRARVHVSDALDETLPYDLVLITLQAQQIASVLPQLQRSAARSIQFMGNTFHPERLRTAIGEGRCSLGMPFIQATVDKDGVLQAKIGAAGQKSKMSNPRWVELFRAVGLPGVLEPNMPLWLRCHAPLGAAFESICVAAMKRGTGASWADATRIARGLQETFTLIQRLGSPLYPAGKARLHASPTWFVATLLWSVSRIRSFRELLATAVNESRGLVEEFVEAAPQAVPPVAVDRIRAMAP